MVEERSSETIMIARVICILCVVYPHFPPFGELSDSPGLFELTSWEISWIFGRNSVAVLSLISGYLLVSTLSRRGYAGTLKRKVSTLLIPLVLWNLISLGFELGMSGFSKIPEWRQLPNMLIALTDTPHLMPLYFLRDVLVCLILSPVVRWLLKKNAILTFILLLANACFNFDRALLINGSILLFSAVGFFLAERKRSLVPPGYGRVWSYILAALVLVVSVNYPMINRLLESPWPTHGKIPESLFVINRICGAYLMWSLAVYLTSLPIKHLIMRFEPVIFFVFCIHPMLNMTIWAVPQSLGAAVGDLGHLIVFVLAPFIVLVLSIMNAFLLAILSPRLLGMLSGGRAPSAHTLKEMLFLPGTL
jgi:hypothetical protein